MKKTFVFPALLFIMCNAVFAQIAINTDNSAPDASAMLDVKSTAMGFLPPRMTRPERNAVVSPIQGLVIYNLTFNKPNYWDGEEWMNFDNTVDLAIGDPYKGGILAYILQPGDPGYTAGEVHGLIAAPSYSNNRRWGCSGTTIGTTSTSLGTGQSNTTAIVNGCNTAGTAAMFCNDLVVNGYSDWYLPSRDELEKLYINKVAIGGFDYDDYWSSSEKSATTAWNEYFPNGFMGGNSKDIQYSVRAIRSF